MSPRVYNLRRRRSTRQRPRTTRTSAAPPALFPPRATLQPVSCGAGVTITSTWSVLIFMPSLTEIWKVSCVSRLTVGAVKRARAASPPVIMTVGPVVCVHLNVSLSPSGSALAEASRPTNDPLGTTWPLPALAMGAASQRPARQLPTLQTVPQAPQLASSVFGSTQALPQIICVDGQARTHWRLTHVVPAPHRVPQPPQLRLSLTGF